MKQTIPQQTAFSLIELMITLIVASILVASLVSLSKSFSSSSAMFTDELAQRRNLLNFSSQLVHDISQAGFVPLDSSLPAVSEPSLSVIFDGAPPPPGGLAVVRSIAIRYDISSLHREFVSYEIRPLDCPEGATCPGASFMKAVFVRRQIQVGAGAPIDIHPDAVYQLALASVESLRCGEIRQAGALRGLDCEVRRYAEFNPSGRVQVEQIKAASDQL
jgi:prepilin-type N-terminal cleavage/methylation domain-containing protein